MTGTHDKVRSLVLTVLMVTSVFAGTIALAGPAAAAGSGNLDLSTSSGAADDAGQDGVKYTQDQTVASGDTLSSVYVDFTNNGNATSPDLSGVTSSDISVYINGSEYSDSFSVTQKTTDGVLQFKLQNTRSVSANANVTVQIRDVVNGDNGTYVFYSELRNAGGTSFSDRADSYELFATGGGGGGGGDQDPPYESDDGDATFDTGSLRWSGQMLFFQSPGNASETFKLYSTRTVNGDQVRGNNPKEIVLNAQGTVLINTAGLSGEYVIVDNNGDRVVTNSNGVQTSTSTSSVIPDDESVLINEQNLDASIDEDSVTQGDEISLGVVSNRGAYNITVSSPGLSDSEVADVFESTTLQINGDGTYTYNVSDDATSGNYTFNFEVEDTTASSSDFVEINEAGVKQATFDQSAYSEERGDNATFTIEMQQGGTAILHVGSNNVNYNATMQVTDDDNDGETTIEWNTYLAGKSKGEENRAFSVVDADPDDDEVDTLSSVKLETDELPADSRLASDNYDLEVFTTEGGDLETQDLAVVSVTERSTDAATQYVAPASADLGNATNTREAASEADAVSIGDNAITEFDVSGIYAYAASEGDLANGSNNGVSVSIVEASASTNALPKEIEYTSDENTDDAATGGPDTVQFNFDESANQFYVTIDTQAVAASQGDTSDLSLQDGETYNVTLTVDGDHSEYVPEGETESVTAQFTVQDPEATLDTNSDGEVVVEPRASQNITGTTNVAPGTELSVRARSEGASAFLKSSSATVQADGTFAATFDFSNVTQNTTFTVTIPNQGYEDNAQTAGIVAPAPTATASISNQTSDGSTVTVDSATLSDGGFVTIHDASLLEGDTFSSVRGTSAYLESGEHSDIEVTLDTPYEETGTVIAMPHLDTNGNEEYDFVTSEGAEDSPYTSNGSAVVASATLTVEEETPTASPSPTDTPEPTETMAPTDTPDEGTPSPSPTPTGQPGFGFAVAIIALAGAALLALRRE